MGYDQPTAISADAGLEAASARLLGLDIELGQKYAGRDIDSNDPIYLDMDAAVEVFCQARSSSPEGWRIRGKAIRSLFPEILTPSRNADYLDRMLAALIRDLTDAPSFL